MQPANSSLDFESELAGLCTDLEVETLGRRRWNSRHLAFTLEASEDAGCRQVKLLFGVSTAYPDSYNLLWILTCDGSCLCITKLRMETSPKLDNSRAIQPHSSPTFPHLNHNHKAELS